MRCRGGETVKLGQMLLAGQHQFGRRQRIGKLSGLFGDLPRIDPDIPDREQDREPDPHHVDFRKFELALLLPRQRVMQKDQNGRADHREGAKQQGHARRQRRRRNQHRAQQQKAERVLQPSGQVEQCRKLGDIEGEQPGGTIGLQPLGLGKGQPQRHIEERRARDNGETGPNHTTA